MAVRYRPDDVLGAKGCVTAEKYAGDRRLHGDFVDHRHVPLVVEFDADVTFDPGEGVFLADGNEHVIAFEELIRFAG